MIPYKLVYRIASDAPQEDVRNFPNDGWAKAYALQDLRFRLSMTEHVEGSVAVAEVDSAGELKWLGTWNFPVDGEGAWTPGLSAALLSSTK